MRILILAMLLLLACSPKGEPEVQSEEEHVYTMAKIQSLYFLSDLGYSHIDITRKTFTSCFDADNKGVAFTAISNKSGLAVGGVVCRNNHLTIYSAKDLTDPNDHGRESIYTTLKRLGYSDPHFLGPHMGACNNGNPWESVMFVARSKKTGKYVHGLVCNDRTVTEWGDL